MRVAHEHSSQHRDEVLGSAQCGCFYCCQVFQPTRIAEWTDRDASGEGQTALCPSCGIDSVIGDLSGFPISVSFLREMKAHWF